MGFMLKSDFTLHKFYRSQLPKYLNKNSTRLFVFLVFISSSIFSQTFELLNTQNLKGGYEGFSSFIDYNSDGYFDIFVTGVDFENSFNNAVFYKNNGDLSFTESTISSIPRVIDGDHSWADFDNNGTQDLLYTGTTSGFSDSGISKIYKNSNNGCEFIELPVALPGISRGNSRWVDIDNDGLMDVFLVGFDINGKIIIKAFKNGGDDSFSEKPITTGDNLSGERGNFSNNTARWEDLDGDGLQDLIIALSTKINFSFEVYRNLGGFKFAKQNIDLPQLSSIAMDIGDVNNDGRPDIVFTGSPNLENFYGDVTGDFYVFTNNGNMNFINSFTIEDEGVLYNDIELADINNDGFLDAVNYGTGPWGTFSKVTKIYKNNKNGTFSNFSHNLPDCSFGGIEFGDFDNDNDLDILYFGRIENPYDNEITYVYENTLLNIELPTEILINNGCACDNSLSFSLNNNSNSIKWDFGDPPATLLNTSTEKKPIHLFSNEGTYTISATFTKGSVSNTLSKVVTIGGQPIIAKPTDLISCTGSNNNQYDFNILKDAEILNGQSTEYFEIFYYASYENSEEDRYRLKMPYFNENINKTIYARVQSTLNSNCFELTDFEITIKDPPIANPIDDFFVCDEDYDGITTFDLTPIEPILTGSQTNITLEYFDEQGNIIPINSLNTYQNSIRDLEKIKIKIIDTQTGCFTETAINLIIDPLPIANPVNTLIGCDDNSDGISEYFDTSNIENQVLNGQTGMNVAYYKEDGTQLPSPLPNPFTNEEPNNQTIIIKVTDTFTNCFSETNLLLKTSAQPNINHPDNLYACDLGNGYSEFDTTLLEEQIIGNQSGLKIGYFDSNNQELPSPLPTLFQNTEPYSQTINIRVEDASNPNCYSETSVNLIVNSLPEINLEEEYFICNLEPSLTLTVNSSFDTYEWYFEDGTLISSSYTSEITKQGNYILTVAKLENNTICNNSFFFNLTRSDLPEILEVKYSEFGNNSIEIISSGSANFEYSIDGTNYQNSNYFTNIPGGIYTVFVRDKAGCGQDSSEVTLIDYPKFFTPNNDGYNDYWQIKGIEKYPNSQIFIFDRYGKLLKQLSTNSLGWDGSFNGKMMFSNDYWFKVNFENGKVLVGHFTLKR